MSAARRVTPGPIATERSIDAWLAVGLVGLAMLGYWFLGRHYASIPDAPGNAHVLGLGMLSLAFTALAVGLALAVRRQSWRTVGLTTTNLRPSTLLGLVIVVVVIAGGLVLASQDGRAPTLTPSAFTFGIPYYLLAIGLAEELLFRGYVTTRLAGAVGHRWLGVVVGGVLFAVMHIPFQAAQTTLPFNTFLAGTWPNLVRTLVLHLLFWWLYRRYDNLAAPTLAHFALNWSSSFLS